MLDLNNHMSLKQAKLEGKVPKRVSLRLPEDLYNALIDESRKVGCSTNELILQKLSVQKSKAKKKK